MNSEQQKQQQQLGIIKNNNDTNTTTNTPLFPPDDDDDDDKMILPTIEQEQQQIHQQEHITTSCTSSENQNVDVVLSSSLFDNNTQTLLFPTSPLKKQEDDHSEPIMTSGEGPNQQQQPPLFVDDDDDDIDDGKNMIGLFVQQQSLSPERMNDHNNSIDDKINYINNNNNETSIDKESNQQEQQNEPSSSLYNHHRPTMVQIPGLSIPNDDNEEKTKTVTTSVTHALPPSFLENLHTNNNNESNTSNAMNGSDLTTTASGQSPNQNSDMNFNNHGNNNKSLNVATISSPWQYDEYASGCTHCNVQFVPVVQGKHHCRLCGYIFCHACTSTKALIPPTRIVLVPKGGKKVKPPSFQNYQDNNNNTNYNMSYTPDPDPDRMITYIASNSDQQQQQRGGNATAATEQLLYGKGLEERIHLARQPLRVCKTCYLQLQPIQEELRNTNSNAVRFNYIDPASNVRLFNSPVAFTLGHEIRKAAYTLNNLLPLPKRRSGGFVSLQHQQQNDHEQLYYHNGYTNTLTVPNYQSELQQCRDQCAGISPNLGELDGVHIPAKLLEQAKGIAVLTVLKGGFGVAGAEFGTGLVVAKLPPLTPTNHSHNNNGSSYYPPPPPRWSAPSAIGTCGVAWGALIGAQVSDHVFVLMTDEAVELMFSDHHNLQLGVDIGVAIGPLGRALESDITVGTNNNVEQKYLTPIYTYSLSKGLYAGISFDNKVIGTRHHVNENFYGYRVSGMDILNGIVPTPPAAQPLYEALTRCHVYAMNDTKHSIHRFINNNNNNNNNNSKVTSPPPSDEQRHQQQKFHFQTPERSGYHQTEQQQPYSTPTADMFPTTNYNNHNSSYPLESRHVMDEYGELQDDDIRLPSRY